MEDDQVMDLGIVSWSELPISRTDLDSHSNMVVIGRNVQITSDASRAVEVSLSAPDYETIN